MSTGAKISLDSFLILFNEVVKHFYRGHDLNTELRNFGFPIGCSLVEVFEEKKVGVEIKNTNIKDAIQYILGTMWKKIYGKKMTKLEYDPEKSEYYMYEDDPPLTKYISRTESISPSSCCNFNAGIIEGMLKQYGHDCNVAAYSVLDDKNDHTDRVVYVVKYGISK